MGLILIIALALVLSTVGIGVTCVNKGIRGKNYKQLMGMNVTAMAGILIVSTIVLLSGGISAFAAEAPRLCLHRQKDLNTLQLP